MSAGPGPEGRFRRAPEFRPATPPRTEGAKKRPPEVRPATPPSAERARKRPPGSNARSAGLATTPPSLSVVLVGFMGAGKTTVGPLVARALGCDFVDLDAAVEQRMERPVPVLIRERGEAFFRRAESAAAAEILAGPPLVLATGGGWAAQPGRIDALAGRARAVWLQVRARTALARMGGQLRDRPLLDGPDALSAARVLLAERTPCYERCAIRIDTEELAPGQVAQEILRRLEGTARSRAPGGRGGGTARANQNEGEASA